MFNFGVMYKVQELTAEYRKKWGRNIDYLGLPRAMSDEVLIKTLERAIETGEPVQDCYLYVKNKL